MTPLAQFPEAGTGKAADIKVLPSTFDSTTLSFDAVTEAGKALFAQMFGAGATGITMPKSNGLAFETFVTRKGLTLA